MYFSANLKNETHHFACRLYLKIEKAIQSAYWRQLVKLTRVEIPDVHNLHTLHSLQIHLCNENKK